MSGTKSSGPVRAVQWAANGTALRKPDGTLVAIGAALAPIASSTSAATANADALQAALTAGGNVSIVTPGDYYIGQAAAATDACLMIPSDVTVYLGRGVRLIQNVAGTFAVSSNWKSNAYTVDSVVSNVESPSHVWSVTFECTANHNLSVGDYAYIKGDVTLTVGGVYKVVAVPTAARFTVLFYSSAGIATGVFSTKPKVYKANANIRWHGDGYLDLAVQGTSGLGAMGIILNKVGRVNFEINVQRATKYGIYFSNAITCKFRSPYSENPSASVQGVGPMSDIEFDDCGGMAGDDVWAVTTSNGTAYTAYDLADADATVNSNGDCVGIRFRNSHPQHVSTRSILLDASTGLKIKLVNIDGFTKWKVGAPLVNFSSPSGLPDGVFDAITIRNCGGFGGPLITADNGAGTFSLGSLTLQNIDLLAPPGSSGSQNGVLLLSDRCTASRSITIDNINLEADNTGSSNLGIVEVSAGTHKHIDITNAKVAISGTGPRTVYGVIATGTVVVTASFNGYRTEGQYGQMFTHGSSGAGEYECSNFYINGSGSFLGSASQGCSVRATNGNLASGDGGFNLYGTSKTYNVSAVNVKTAGQSLVYNLGASSTLNLAGGAIDTTADLVRAAGVGASAVVRLQGASFGGSQIDGTKLDSTVTNHRAGAAFYNNSASFGAGVGAYVRGASTWTRVAA